MDIIFEVCENITPSFLVNKETDIFEKEAVEIKKEDQKQKQKSKNNIKVMAIAIALMSQRKIKDGI
ncbi:hypothetical protein C1646_757943 [Rhizophagus diaphanus]|nr:hypothetical protein C1646_757943 [Rhizophagus diaphanus] [Rhizophagus sp. MUCL 43196]